MLPPTSIIEADANGGADRRTAYQDLEENHLALASTRAAKETRPRERKGIACIPSAGDTPRSPQIRDQGSPSETDEEETKAPDRLTTEPAAGPSPSEKKVASAAATGGSSTGKQREAPVHSLPRPKALDLEKQTLTYLTEAPGSAPPQRGRGRRDLFQNDDAAPASSPPPRHETLEKLGPKLPANGEPTVFPTSRSLDGHRR